jgi:chromosome segregation ATPase
MRRLPLFLIALAIAVTAAASPRRDGYVFVPHSGNMISSNMDLDHALAIRHRFESRFLWIRHEGREYLIRDAATLDEIERLFEPSNIGRPELARLHEKIRPLEHRESQLDREADAISDDDDRTERDEARLRDLHVQLRDVEAQLRVLERQQEEIEAKQDRAEEEAERKMIPVVERAIRSGAAKRPD